MIMNDETSTGIKADSIEEEDESFCFHYLVKSVAWMKVIRRKIE